MSDASTDPAAAPTAAHDAGPPPAAPLLECDIIMKGGITSGVVYPLAACHLAERYRFRQVGGASAGAIAAAFAAAAEHDRDGGGFDRLALLPNELGAELEHLFQPSPVTAVAHGILSTAIDPGAGRLRKARRILGRILRASWLRALITFVVLGGIGLALAWLLIGLAGDGSFGAVLLGAVLWLPLAALLTFVLATVAVGRRTMAGIAENGFGLCDGHTATEDGHLPLTDWMADRIDWLAGRSTTGRPLTVGDLWGPEAVAAFEAAVPADKGFLDLLPHQRREVRAPRRIDLEVMTTNLTLRRPYRFPFETRVFSFCPTCMRRYFPERVVAQLVASGAEVVDRDDLPFTMTCPFHPGVRVRELPRPHQVPVVVAARISLSFPGLISAVPLCYVDFARVRDKTALIPVWFSDGGIASNFPMHLFDTMWPNRPTFGINLQPKDPEHGADDVALPKSGMPRSHPMTSVPDFVKALADTLENWSDVTQLTLPAYRSRVAEIRLTDEEGGMNLRMPADVITRLAGLGEDAAALFDDFDLPAHQLRRFEAAMALIDDLLDGLRRSAAGGFDAVVAASAPAHRRAAAAALLDLAHEWHDADHPATASDVPRPIADLRAVPRQ